LRKENNMDTEKPPTMDLENSESQPNTNPPPTTEKKEGRLFERKVGGFWTKLTKNNEKYLSGEVRLGGKEYHVFILRNQRKVKDTYPDWEMFLFEDEFMQAKKDEAANVDL